MLQYEHEQRLRLEEMVEQLAKQHSSLEKQARKSLAAVTASNHATHKTDANQNAKGNVNKNVSNKIDLGNFVNVESFPWETDHCYHAHYGTESHTILTKLAKHVTFFAAFSHY